MTNEDKILSMLAGLQTDMTGMRTEMMGMRTDITALQTDMTGMRTDITALQTEMTDMRADMTSMRTDISSMQNGILKINIKLETNIEDRLDALAEGHAAILERMVPRTRVDDLEDEVRFMKTVMRQMSDEIQLLKKAQ